MSYQFPDNLNYADTHEYVLEENGFLKIGVSEFAIDQLGDIVFVELADQGATLEKVDTFESGLITINHPSPMGSFCKSSGLSITLSFVDTISPEKGK